MTAEMMPNDTSDASDAAAHQQEEDAVIGELFTPDSPGARMLTPTQQARRVAILLGAGNHNPSPLLEVPGWALPRANRK
jgi:hypothetical protein